MNKTPTWWQTILLTLICSLITAAFSFGLIRSGSSSDKTKEELKLKADKTYVDQQDNAIRDDLRGAKEDMYKTVDRIDANLTEIRSYILKSKQ